MTSEKRNAAVVIALIASITGGVLVLLGFEKVLYPLRPRPEANINLTALTPAEQAAVDVEVVCTTEDQWRANRDSDSDGFSIFPDGQITGELRGQHVRLLVVSPDGRTLADVQKRALLGTLKALVGDREGDLAPVQLAQAEGSAAAEELRKFLILKGIIRN